MRCGTISVKGERVFIPFCWGAVIYGKAACTCPRREPSEATEIKNQIARLQAKLDELKRKSANAT